MSDSVNVKSPVEIKDNSKERVAFDLMVHAGYRERNNRNDQSDRKYWLTLYRQCYKAAQGFDLVSTLKEE